MVRTLDADSTAAFERNRYKSSDQGRRDRLSTRSAGKPGNTAGARQARSTSAGSGRAGQARSTSAGSGRTGQARSTSAGSGRAGQARSTSAGSSRAGQARSTSAGAGRTRQMRSTSAAAAGAGRDIRSSARTGRYEETAKARGVRVAEANREAGKTVRRSSPAAMSLQTVAGMLVIIAVMTVVLIYYIKLQADVTRTSQEIAVLEQQLTQIKAENDASYNEISDSISLEEVRKRAIQDLGMKYADRDQVIIYTGTEKDSVHQVSSLNDR